MIRHILPKISPPHGGRGRRGGGTQKVYILSTPTVRRHSPSSDASIIMTALDGGALALPHQRGRVLWGDLKIFFVNLSRPYNFGLISKTDCHACVPKLLLARCFDRALRRAGTRLFPLLAGLAMRCRQKGFLFHIGIWVCSGGR